MFREMRRAKQQLSEEACIEILKNGTEGILSVLGDEDYPYGIPLNYFYYENQIYFHCAKSGHKVDAVKKHEKVSFCVVDKHTVLPESYSTEYTSVIVFGRARMMEDPDEMRRMVQLLSLKYCPGDEAGVARETEREFHALGMIELSIEHMTGKQSKNLSTAD